LQPKSDDVPKINMGPFKTYGMQRRSYMV